MLNFLRNCRQFSKVVLPCYLLAHSECKFLFSTFLPTLDAFSLFNFSRFNGSVVVAHSGFNLCFPDG